MLTRALIGGSLLLMASAPGPAAAHGATRGDVRVLLDGVVPSVPGLRVQVFDDHLAPQLVIENRTSQALEVLDERLRPFLRVGPGGVEADLAAAAWYETVSPGGAAVPVAARDAQARADWRHVRHEPAWGWFDLRLDRRHAPSPPPGAHGAAVLQHWSVPVRLGRREIEIRGHFLYQPEPAGAFVARLTSSEISPAVRVTLAAGQPPALLLENRGGDPVVVLGAQGEPFLRIAPDGVDANLASPTWQDLGRYRGLDASLGDTSAPRWQRISLAPRYTWLEPRAGLPALPAPGDMPDNTRAKVKGWRVPIRIGSRDLAIQGVVEWVPRSQHARASAR